MLRYRADQLRHGHQVRKLDQRQRIPAGRPDQLVESFSVKAADPMSFQHLLGCWQVKPCQQHAGNVSKPGRAPVDVTRGDKKNHTFRAKTPRHKMKRLHSGTIQPMRIINHRQQRYLFCGHRKQAQQCRADRESVADRKRSLFQRQRDPQCAPLRFGQIWDQVRDVTDQLSKATARQINLGLDAADAEDRHLRRLVNCVVQKRRLAHPRLALNHQRRTPAALTRPEQLSDATALTIAPDQGIRYHQATPSAVPIH